MITANFDSATLNWDAPPLNWLSSTQQVKFRAEAKIHSYRLGEKIWSTEASGELFLLVASKVRVREEVTQFARESKLVERSTTNKPLATT